MRYVNVLQDIEGIPYQTLGANRLMHVPSVQSRPYAKLHQPAITFANVHKATLVTPNRLAVSQSVNAHMAIQIVQIQHVV